MAIIKTVQGIHPKIGANCFLADNAVIVGDVTLGDNCSVWFSAVVRGDVNSVVIGNKVNIQDGAVIHCTYKKAKTNIGHNVNIGHHAIIHGCTLEDEVIIGMGAIILDHAIVQKRSYVAAGSVVKEYTVVESGYLYAGTPARKIKPLTEEQLKLLAELPDRYVMYSGWYISQE